MHRVHARRAARIAAATAFVSAPEPRSIGRVSRGRQFIAGNFLFAGHLVEGPNLSIWDVAGDKDVVAGELQSCRWLDDLVAVGDDRARAKAQEWVFDWIDRYGNGTGPGWVPDLVGGRLIRWINHGFFLLRGQSSERSTQFFESLAQQTIFLARRWNVTAAGLPRFEALTGMIYAGLSLEGMEDHLGQAVAALAADCDTQIDEQGGIPTRNPEELLEVATLLNWTVQALDEMGHDCPDQIKAAVGRVAPTLRALRHSDGGLARFHGGGRGIEGRLEQALVSSGTKALPDATLYMGFARLSAGRTSLIVDAAKPPSGPASINAHASTLAFELTSGRRPVVVSCGSGTNFGENWRRASRATPSHSTLGIEGFSSARVGVPGRMSAEHDMLTDGPTIVHFGLQKPDGKRRLEMSHNGYQASHGLTHARVLDMSFDGRSVDGEDLLATLTEADNGQFAAALAEAGLTGIPFSIRFHLHPDVEATIDMGATAVSLTLKSGEVWVFRHDGSTKLQLVPSVFLENGRLKPRETQQVVLSGRTMSYATRVRWSLAKAHGTPDAVRDLEQADPMDSFDD